MNTQTIKIGSTIYTVKFGIKSDRILGEMWGVNKPSQVFEKLQKAFDLKPDQEPEFEQLVTMSQLILSGIKSVDSTADVDEDDVYRAITAKVTVLESLIGLYLKSQPQISEVEKNVNPDQRKKK